MTRQISATLRQKVAERANYCCEYCRLPEVSVLLKFQIEHIISLQHGGKTILSNLAYACPICNSKKGPNVGTVLEDEETFTPFFHPRKHQWADHFEIREGVIFPRTNVGEGTIKVLGFNDMERVLERIDLIKAGLYP